MKIWLVKTCASLPYLNNNLIANIVKSTAKQIDFFPSKCYACHYPPFNQGSIRPQTLLFNN